MRSRHGGYEGRKEKMMNKQVMDKVMQMGLYDTAKYRYILVECGDRAVIRRIELDKLGTTAALDGWETVKEIV